MKKIAVIPGDGVGPEVTAAACRVLDRVTELDPAIRLHTDEFPWSAESYLSSGEMMPPDGLEILSSYDALLLGAIGWPGVPDHITLRELLLEIRGGFDQYVNLRPVRLLPGIDSPLAGRTADDIDMIFVREGTEGEYAGVGARLYRGTSREVALQTAVFSRHGCERVIRWAFELAAREGRPIASISKGNALNYSAVFWDQVFDEVAAGYPQVRAERLLVDAAAMFMVTDPRRFGVVVASNLFGDILTDLGAAIMGGMGFAPSANLNPERVFPSMFEPIHGSAPDIAGQGKANPIGTIWSVSMMLDHLGYPEWASSVMRAIESVLAERSARTPDLGGSSSTEQMCDAVLAALQAPGTR
jgi:tartrate dehydrogenase/decarboxylase/D-malate dehydrogenase